MAESKSPAAPDKPEAKASGGSQFEHILELAGELPEGAHVPASSWGAVVSVLAHGTGEAQKLVDDARKSAETESEE